MICACKEKDMDFFYDGGTKVITPENNCRENISGIGDFLSANDTIDFIFLQEIDKDSKRSYRINEYENISKLLRGYNPSFALNYDVFFVPVPPSKPMGKVVAGLAVFSKYTPESSTRSLSREISASRHNSSSSTDVLLLTGTELRMGKNLC